MQQREMLHNYNYDCRPRFNQELFNHKDDDLINVMKNLILSCERDSAFTIKVLGFYDKEVSAYIYRENIILTIIGTVVGLGLGTILHKFIMVTVEIQSMMFGRVIDMSSYFIAAVLTIVLSLFVNLAMFYKLRNVKMVESLKSVD